MENTEWTNEFDILYNNITSNQSPGLDEYEKSVFLTMAYEELVKDYFTASQNKMQSGFDGDEVKQAAFSKLIEVKDDFTIDAEGFIQVPSDLNIFLVLNEYVDTSSGGKVVVPLDYREYERLMSKPYHFPLKNQAWRLDQGFGKFKIIVGPNDTIDKYTMRFIHKPLPIILNDFSEDGLSIEGYSSPIEGKVCHADSSVHRTILQRAVELAKVSYTGDISAIVGLGNASQTPLIPATTPYNGYNNGNYGYRG